MPDDRVRFCAFCGQRPTPPGGTACERCGEVAFVAVAALLTGVSR